MRICPTCSTTYPTQVGFCPKDGSPLVEVQEWTPGATIRGKYRILSTVGKGGMGSVYKALHLGFQELRALKVLNQQLAADARFVKRFKQEAFATRKLQHPNVVRVEDIDETEEGRPFIVMEFIEGRSLRQLIEKHGAMRMAAACSVVKQIASALAVAHRLGVVHRDLKPDNIVLVAPPKGPGAPTEPIVKVLDFGIAKLNEVRAESNPEDSTLTQPGTIMGTPRYMSPEQAKGKRGDDLDGRSDIYSLGILMYQMLTGQMPFQGTTTMEMLLAHLQEEPTPIRSIRPDLRIPEPIADIVMQCLEKNPEARPQTAEVLIEALERAEAMCMEAAFAQESFPSLPKREVEPVQLQEPETVFLQEHPALVQEQESQDFAQRGDTSGITTPATNSEDAALAQEIPPPLNQQEKSARPQDREAALVVAQEAALARQQEEREHEAALVQEREAALAREREAVLAREHQAALVREEEIRVQEAVQAEEGKIRLALEQQAEEHEATLTAPRNPGGMQASVMVPAANPNVDEVLPATAGAAKQAQTPVLESSAHKAVLPATLKKSSGQPFRGKGWVIPVAGISVLVVIGVLMSNRGRKVPDAAVPNVQHELSTPVATPSPTSFQNEKKPETPFRAGSEAKQTPEKVKPQKPEPPSKSAVTPVSPAAADNQARMLEVQKQVRATEEEGETFRKLGKYDEAIRVFERGLQLDPTNAGLQDKIAKSRRAKAAEQEVNH